MKALWRCLISLVVGCLVGGRMAVAQDAAAPSFDALGIDEATAKEIGLVFENVEIEVEGLKRDYLFLWIADLHVITDDLSEVAPDELETVKARRDKAFRNSQTKLSALEVWQRLIPVLNRSNADAVLLGGDICDFGSLSNIQAIKDGLAQLTKPYLYARADHDISPWWLAERKLDEVAALEQSIDGNEPVQVLEAEDLMVVSFNVSTSNLPAEGLKRFKEVYAKGKPILLVTHVPIYTPLAVSLGLESMSRDSQQRNLTWGKGCYYSPNATTQEFLDMVLAEDSPVVGVMAGHLHFPWRGSLTLRTTQYLCGAAYQGKIGVISLKRKETRK